MSQSNQIVRPKLITRGNASYESVILVDRPVAYYPLNEMAGKIAHDRSGNGNMGTIQGGVTLGQPGGLADGSSAMGFNGSSTSIAIGSVLGGTAALSVEAWAKLPAGYSYDTFYAIFATAQAYLRYSGDSHNWSFFLQQSEGSYPGLITGGLPEGGVFYHLVGTWNGSEMVLYVNGVQKGTASNSEIVSPSSSTIGAGFFQGSGGNNFLGNIQHVAIYPTALSAARVLAHYNAGRTALRRAS